jgi:ABC-type transporter MlaC component
MKTMIALLLLLPQPLLAAIGDPKNVVEEIFAKASLPAIAKDIQQQQMVSSLVDFQSLAAAALGSEKKKIPAKEFEWFRSTLQEIITRTVYPKAPEFLAGVKIQYDAVEEKKGFTLVKSTIQNKADLTEVEYKLALSGENWRVVDISISGISWTDSIRDQVRDVVKKKKWKGLKEAMEKRLADLKAGK